MSFAVAAGSRLAADAAAEVLGAGGSAVDAAIAGALCACVAEPVMAGLMGGGFLMVREPDGTVAALDAFVHTPRRPLRPDDSDIREIEADFGAARQRFHVGAGTIATPGVGPGLWEAHRRFGRIPMRDLAAPACAAARAGTPLDAFGAAVLRVVLPIATASPATRSLWLGGAEAVPEPGTLLRNAALADVIETFAHEGARFLQEGEPAAALVALCAAGGHLTADDLRRYAPVWRTPHGIVHGGARIALNPAPALGGLLAALALGQMPPRAGPAARAQALVALDRARSGAAGDAGRLADPALRAALSHPAAPRGTTHLSAVDAQGLGAALSLSNGEGCGLVLPGIGIMPNNMLGEADLVPEPGRFAADMRLASMMAPCVMQWADGRVALLGSGGSTRIPGAVAQVLAALADGAALDAAVEAPRLHVHEGALEAETPETGAERAALLKAWPEATLWPEPSMYFGGVHAVLREARGAAVAAADPRRSGVARAG